MKLRGQLTLHLLSHETKPLHRSILIFVISLNMVTTVLNEGLLYWIQSIFDLLLTSFLIICMCSFII
jgi:hypothetical protein